jgi:fructokinase
MLIMGLDIGGTKIEAALAKITTTPQGERGTQIAMAQQDVFMSILTRKRCPTNRDGGFDAVLTTIAQLIKEIMEEQGLSLFKLDGIGAGLPGTVDPKTSIMLNGNSKIFVDKAFASELQNKLGQRVPTYCTNDANLFALAEVYGGAGVKFAQESNIPITDQIGIGLILGTGVGGGVIIHGKTLLGRFGGGAEVGHTTLVSDGEPCYCGQRGCVECYLSGSGLERNYLKTTGEGLKGAEIFKLEQEAATKAVSDYCQHLRNFLINLTNTFDPDYFVLGGGVSLQPSIYQGLEEYIRQNSFVPNSAPKVYQHQLGDSAGVLGAVIFCANREWS